MSKRRSRERYKPADLKRGIVRDGHREPVGWTPDPTAAEGDGAAVSARGPMDDMHGVLDVEEQGMKERPIIFSGESLPAILDGRKIQTRRILSPQPVHTQHYEWRGKLIYEGEHRLWCWRGHTFENIWDFGERNEDRRQLARLCPLGAVGDRLWVKEAHAQFAVGNRTSLAPQCVAYRATCDENGAFDYVNNGDEVMRLKVTKWTSPLFMPRWASRIALDLAEVRVQRLQEINEDDARAEGVEVGKMQPAIVNGEPGSVMFFNARDAYAYRWAALHGRDSWKANPFVWALTFRRVPP